MLSYIDVLKDAIKNRPDQVRDISRVFFSHILRVELATANKCYGLNPPYYIPNVKHIKDSTKDWQSVLAEAKAVGYTSIEEYFNEKSDAESSLPVWFHPRRGASSTAKVVSLSHQYKNLYQQLCTAVKCNNLSKIQHIVELMKNYPQVIENFNKLLATAKLPVTVANPRDLQQTVNGKDDKTGNTVLHDMAAIGNLAVVQVLLEAKADVMQLNKEKQLPLMLAAKAGHTQVVQSLLAAGAQDAEEGATALIQAIQQSHVHVVKVLLERYQYNKDSSYLQEAFYAALKTFNPAMIKLLTNKLWSEVVSQIPARGKIVNIFEVAVPGTTQTPLCFLLTTPGDMVIRQQIIKDFLNQARINLGKIPTGDLLMVNNELGLFSFNSHAKDATMTSALHCAAALTDEMIALDMLKLSRRDSGIAQDLLEYAKQNQLAVTGSEELVMLSTIVKVDAQGQSPLIVATERLHVRTVARILANIQDEKESEKEWLNKADKRKRTPLYAAAHAVAIAPILANRVKASVLIRQFITLGADVNVIVGEDSALSLLVKSNLVVPVQTFLQACDANPGNSLNQETLKHALLLALNNSDIDIAIIKMLTPLVEDLSSLLSSAATRFGAENDIAALHASREQDKDQKEGREKKLKGLIASQETVPMRVILPDAKESAGLMGELYNLWAIECRKGCDGSKKLLAEAPVVLQLLIEHCRAPVGNYKLLAKIDNCITVTDALIKNNEVAKLLKKYREQLFAKRQQIHREANGRFFPDLNSFADKELQMECQNFLGDLRISNEPLWREFGGEYATPTVLMVPLPEAKTIPLEEGPIGDIYSDSDLFRKSSGGSLLLSAEEARDLSPLARLASVFRPTGSSVAVTARPSTTTIPSLVLPSNVGVPVKSY